VSIDKEIFSCMKALDADYFQALLSVSPKDISIIDETNGDTLLHSAIRNERSDIARVLISYLFENCPSVLKEKNHDGKNPLQFAREKVSTQEIVQEILINLSYNADLLLFKKIKSDPDYVSMLIKNNVHPTPEIIVGVANFYYENKAKEVYALMLEGKNFFHFVKAVNKVSIIDNDGYLAAAVIDGSMGAVTRSQAKTFFDNIKNIISSNGDAAYVWDKYANANTKEMFRQISFN